VGRRGFYEGAGNEHPVSLTAEVMEPPNNGMPGWQWKELPATMNQQRYGAGGCVLSDGRFAVFGGTNDARIDTKSCEVLTLDGEERWHTLAPMHEARTGFACAAVGRCVIVAGGEDSLKAETYEEALGRWKRLPYGIPRDGDWWCAWMGSALI